jgi:pullulanase
MAPIFDLLERRKDKFMLWLPAGLPNARAPYLVIGTFDKGPPPTVYQTNISPFINSGHPDLWELDPKTISPPLKDNTIFHYWYEINDLSPEGLGAIQVTDPLAYTIDYRSLRSRDEHSQPASVIKFRDGKLWPCDIDGNEPRPPPIPSQDSMPQNNHMVIYELPTSWSRYKDEQQNNQDVQIDVGTFTDVLALFDAKVAGKRFAGIPAIDNEAIVAELGINALELLPAADAKSIGQWGYATANYYATDFDLGTSGSWWRRYTPSTHASSRMLSWRLDTTPMSTLTFANSISIKTRPRRKQALIGCNPIRTSHVMAMGEDSGDTAGPSMPMLRLFSLPRMIQSLVKS